MIINIKDYLNINQLENNETNSKNISDEELMKEALKAIIAENKVSISFLQRKFSIGFARASFIVEKMEELKFISKAEDEKPRKVFITQEEFNKIYGDNND